MNEVLICIVIVFLSPKIVVNFYEALQVNDGVLRSVDRRILFA